MAHSTTMEPGFEVERLVLEIERMRWRLANAIRRRARVEGPAAA